MKGTKSVDNENDGFQDEIKDTCSECGVEKVLAYWDSELETYIYLVDDLDINEDEHEFICEACQLITAECESA